MVRALRILLLAVMLSACAKDTIDSRRFGQQLVCHDGEETLAMSNANSFVHLEHGVSPGPCPDE
jgi:hypothetical protein